MKVETFTDDQSRNWPDTKVKKLEYSSGWENVRMKALISTKKMLIDMIV
jgi:hypothetical protein